MSSSSKQQTQRTNFHRSSFQLLLLSSCLTQILTLMTNTTSQHMKPQKKKKKNQQQDNFSENHNIWYKQIILANDVEHKTLCEVKVCEDNEQHICKPRGLPLRVCHVMLLLIDSAACRTAALMTAGRNVTLIEKCKQSCGVDARGLSAADGRTWDRRRSWWSELWCEETLTSFQRLSGSSHGRS